MAIGIADEHGLEAVSTRAVAAHFGKTPMALYAYVGSKEHLLALMQDHASEMPPPGPGDDLLGWADAFFELHLAHPWLVARNWAQGSQGPNEQDWMERLLTVLGTAGVPAFPAVTVLYATVRATAETAAAYRRLAAASADAWLAQAVATRRLIPDFAERYPLATGSAPDADWREAPRAALVAAVHLIAGTVPPGP